MRLLRAAALAACLGPALFAQAQDSVVTARANIQKNPKQPQPYTDLAAALVRKARDTANLSLYEPAEDAVRKSLEMAPGYFQARRVEVQILLGKREFSRALELAKELNHIFPDDNLTRGLIADADIALGDYKAAEDSVQWMLNMNHVNPPALERGAALRDLFGYPDPAIEWWTSALRLTSTADVEERAWILTRTAGVQMRAGRLENADKYLQQALALVPEYPLALAALGRLRFAQSKFPEAVELFRRRLKIGPDFGAMYGLAEALEHAGSAGESQSAWADFERKAMAAVDKPDNGNRELVFYYADHAGKPQEALRIARIEIARRHDVCTLDALAWALYKAGDYGEARVQIGKALAPGVKDPGFLEHQRAIEAKSTP